MKANEVPEKIYLTKLMLFAAPTINNSNNDIEYIRKDSFIEKACEFLKSYRQDTLDGTGYVAGIVNNKTIEAFKCYMKGE